MPDRASRKIQKALDSNQTSLDLGKMGLAEIPDALFQLKNLRYLRLSNRIWDYGLRELTESENRGEDNEFRSLHIGEEISALSNLEILYLGGDYLKKWKISSIEFLIHLPNLHTLDLSSLDIKDISVLGHLKKLRNLSLFNNSISDISILKSLPNLEVLNITGNKIKDITSLEKLKGLRILHLKRNNISSFTPIVGLSKLEDLDISSNPLESLKFIRKLSSLTVLTARNTNLQIIEDLKGLSLLSILDLRSNKIKIIKPLGNLGNLLELDLRNNKITNLQIISRLHKLEYLNIGNNQIKDITPLSGLGNLRMLDISFNAIQDLSPLRGLILEKRLPVVLRLSKKYLVGAIYIEGNKVSTPPKEIISRGAGAVLSYFKLVKKQGVKNWYEAKVLIVGEGQVGKTSLWKRLIDSDYGLSADEVSTLGINIHNGWDFPHPEISEIQLKAHLWDFGGQEIQYAVHQFFLTERSLYVLMIDEAKRSTNNLDYWFSIISNLRDKSPVLLVKNSISNIDIEFNKEYYYYNRYAGLLKIDRGDLHLDKAPEHEDFQNLVEKIKLHLSRLPQMKLTFPAQWVHVREHLQNMSDEGRNYILLSEYFDICRNYQINKKQDCLNLSGFLHDLGIVLHFQKDKTLSNILVLNPKWAINGIYSIFSVEVEKGIFHRSRLERIWELKNYTTAERKYLMSLLLKDQFELCYPISNKAEAEEAFVSPILLPEFPPPFPWKLKVRTRVLIEYPFLPKGIIPRLIVRMSQQLYVLDDHLIQWKYGAVFQWKKKKNILAKVYSPISNGLPESKIWIEVDGSSADKRKKFIQEIIDELTEISKVLVPNINQRIFIPCNCSKCLGSTAPQLFRTSYLLEKLDKKNLDKPDNYFKENCQNSFLEFDLKEILNRVYFEEDYLPKSFGTRKSELPQLFISFAEDDRLLLEELEKHLKFLELAGKIRGIWHSKMMALGSDRIKMKRKELNNSNIILFLVSPSSMNDDELRETELKLMLKRADSGNCVFIPVILRPCDWKGVPILNKFNAFPRGEKAIIEWNNRDAAWKELIRGLGTIMKK